MTFDVVGVLEAGTAYRVGSLNGELVVAEKDIPRVTWVESYDSYDVMELADGTRIYVPDTLNA